MYKYFRDYYKIELYHINSLERNNSKILKKLRKYFGEMGLALEELESPSNWGLRDYQPVLLDLGLGYAIMDMNY
jgi:hypothetical protein